MWKVQTEMHLRAYKVWLSLRQFSGSSQSFSTEFVDSAMQIGPVGGGGGAKLFSALKYSVTSTT